MPVHRNRERTNQTEEEKKELTIFWYGNGMGKEKKNGIRKMLKYIPACVRLCSCSLSSSLACVWTKERANRKRIVLKQWNASLNRFHISREYFFSIIARHKIGTHNAIVDVQHIPILKYRASSMNFHQLWLYSKKLSHLLLLFGCFVLSIATSNDDNNMCKE